MSANAKKILVVEDDVQTRNEIVDYFRSVGYSVSEAPDGKVGYEIVRQDPVFDFILTDYNMVPWNGLDMIEKIRSEIPECRSVLIVLSTEKSADHSERSKRLGVKLWKLKPFDGPTVNQACITISQRQQAN